MTVKPYNQEESKKVQVEEMFDTISPKYDFLNHFFSAGVDKRWRKKIRKMVATIPHEMILDVATGTADLCVELAKLPKTTLTGLDISKGMLEKGQVKIEKKELDRRITLVHGDSENMPFEEDMFDVVTVSFGVRNFQNLEKGLSECLRVLKPKGKLIVLEFSNPTGFPVKQLFNFYSGKVMPALGGMFSKDKKAYKYLHDSSRAFPNGNDFIAIMKKVGFKENTFKSLSSGIASIYNGQK